MYRCSRLEKDNDSLDNTGSKQNPDCSWKNHRPVLSNSFGVVNFKSETFEKTTPSTFKPSYKYSCYSYTLLV